MHTKRLWIGFAWGVFATIAMSILMIIGKASGIAPMPAPIPIAIIKHLIGKVPKLAIILLAIIAHLGYGGMFGAIFAVLTKRITILKGIGFSILLWLLMQLLVLPYLGWGVFGMSITPKIAVATLVLHLVYGITFGGLMDRNLTNTKAGQ